MSANGLRAIGVSQQGWGITNSTSSAPIIGTIGLGPCVGMFVYNKIFKVASLAHIDAGTRIESISDLFDTMLELSEPKDLRITLLGGWKTEVAGENTSLVNYITTHYRDCTLDTRYFCKLDDPYPNREWELRRLNEEEKKHVLKSYVTTQMDSRTGKIIARRSTIADLVSPCFDYGSEAESRYVEVAKSIQNKQIDTPLVQVCDERNDIVLVLTKLGEEYLASLPK